jgi:8-oxo-dGTP pyrophosphatase MutT (NUDIX family)
MLDQSKGFKPAACVVVTDCENRVLVTRRADTMSFFKRAWVLPGGHVDPGEHLQDAALRELDEECGI